MLKKNLKILFLGDSIMASGRNQEDNNSKGYGYVSMLENYFITKYSDLNIKIINRGISGNRSSQILERFEIDALNEEPDIIFLGCGVNDSWHRYSVGIETTNETFTSNITYMIEKAQLNKIKIVLIEPFLLNEPAIRMSYREDLNPKLTILKELAKNYQIDLIPLDEIMLKSANKIGSSKICVDGVHPTLLGHGLIADTIIDYFSWRK